MSVILFTGSKLIKTQPGVISFAFVQSSNYSSETKAYNLSQLKRGTGGRSSFSGIVATVFGATGFLGRYVCNRLGKIGSQLIIPYRGDFYDAQKLKVCGDLGQVLFLPYHLRDEESLRKAMKYSNVVINLIGRDWETKNFKFKDVHVDGAARIARIAKQSGVEKFIHISSLNASTKPEKVILPKGSQFLVSKAQGEVAVLQEFPEAIIFRPSDIYGQEDRFLRYYAHQWRRQGTYMPLWKKGEATIKQPVAVYDVAAAIIAAVKDPDADGKIFQAVGPRKYYLSDLVDWFFKVMRKGEEYGYWRYDMRYDPLFRMKVSLTNLMSPGYPLANLHWEKIEREHLTDKVDNSIPTLEDLGITLTLMENQIPWELKPWIHGLYHGYAADEPFDPPEPPKAVC